MTAVATLAPISLVAGPNEARVDSRLLAGSMGLKHQSLFELLKDHRPDFEEIGLLRFQTGVIEGRGQPEKFAMLNEDQAYLLLTYSRNTKRVRSLKVNLVKAFGEARRAAHLHGAEYLPTYRQLHDAIHNAAAGSSNERFVHMNVNRLVNKTAGIGAGQRGGVTLAAQSMLVVAQAVAASVMQGAPNHHAGYARTKEALSALTACAALGVTVCAPGAHPPAKCGRWQHTGEPPDDFGATALNI